MARKKKSRDDLVERVIDLEYAVFTLTRTVTELQQKIDQYQRLRDIVFAPTPVEEKVPHDHPLL
jgi:uncharacterized protein YlxW (UPF0749 family)